MSFQPNNMTGPPPRDPGINRPTAAWLDMLYRFVTGWFAKERQLGDGLEYNSADVKQVKVADPVTIDATGAVTTTFAEGDVLRWIDLGF